MHHQDQISRNHRIQPNIPRDFSRKNTKLGINGTRLSHESAFHIHRRSNLTPDV